MLMISVLYLQKHYASDIIDLRECREKEVWIYSAMVLVLVYLILFRDHINCVDYPGYRGIFYRALDQNLSKFLNGRVEPTYWLMTKIVQYLFDSNLTMIFILYGLLGLIIKSYVILKESRYPLYSLLIYFSTFFFLHELTQLRVAVAIGFLFVAVMHVKQRSYLIALISYGIGIAFHYSLLIALPFLLLYIIFDARLLRWLSWLFLFLLVSQITFQLMVNIMPSSSLTTRLINYTVNLDRYGNNSFFTIGFVMRICIALFFIIFYRLDRKTDDPYTIYIGMFFYGMILYLFFSPYPVLYTRLSEILFFSEVLLLPIIIDYFKQRWVPNIALILYISYSMAINVIYHELINIQVLFG